MTLLVYLLFTLVVTVVHQICKNCLCLLSKRKICSVNVVSDSLLSKDFLSTDTESCNKGDFWFLPSDCKCPYLQTGDNVRAKQIIKFLDM